MRTFVIGDIHGAYKALKQLIDRLNLQKGDKLIFLGDYADGWSEVVEVIDYLLELKEKYTCRFIRGNHDTKAYAWITEQKVIGDWLIHGGGATQKAYANVSDPKVTTHLTFLENLENYYLDEQNRLFLHAGFTAMRGVERESSDYNFYWDRTLWEAAFALDPTLDRDAINYPGRLKIYHEIYIGHTATTRFDTDQPIQCANLWNVDTGTAFWGKLTALNIDTKEYIQSDKVATLYPDEKGRN